MSKNLIFYALLRAVVLFNVGRRRAIILGESFLLYYLQAGIYVAIKSSGEYVQRMPWPVQ